MNNVKVKLNDLNYEYGQYQKALNDRDFVGMANTATWGLYTLSSQLDPPFPYQADQFGVCPECLETDGCLHVGRDEWFVCHKHKVKWLVGSNLFSNWKDMTDEQFEKNAKLLSGYKEVKEINLILKNERFEEKIMKEENAEKLTKKIAEINQDARERIKARVETTFNARDIQNIKNAQKDELREACKRYPCELAETVLGCIDCENPAQPAKPKELPKLYRLRSILPKYEYAGCYYKDVQMTWCVEKRERPPIPYERGIKDYKPDPQVNKQYCEDALDEYFTKAEAEVFKTYVRNVYGDDTVTTEEIELPIDNDSYPYTAITLGRGIDIMDLSVAANYCLNFKVSGLFNVRGKKPIEENTNQAEKSNQRDIFENLAVRESRRRDNELEDIMKLKDRRAEVIGR